jgi:hypothetical protein
MHTHKAELVKMESAITGFLPVVMSKEYDLTIGTFSNTGKFDAESLAISERSPVDLKQVETSHRVAKLYSENGCRDSESEAASWRHSPALQVPISSDRHRIGRITDPRSWL